MGGRFSVCALLLLLLLSLALSAAPSGRRAQAPAGSAPGAPGAEARWPSAGKEGVGTSNTERSKVWFTLRGGVMDEVYYPTVDVANSQRLELVIARAGAGGAVQTEERDTVSQVIPDEDALAFTQVNTAKDGEYRVEKRYVTDPERDVVLVRVRFFGHLRRGRDDYGLFVYYDPSLGNSGLHDTAFTERGALVARDADKASALVVSSPLRATPPGEGGFLRTTNGFLGASDGLTQMRARAHGGRFPPEFTEYARAEDGNVVQLGELPRPGGGRERGRGEYTLALGFGKTTGEALAAARASLGKGFDACEAEYKKGWQDYLKTVRRVAPARQRQYDTAAMVLKAHEDKTYRGAMIASLSVPWGGGHSANEAEVGGYHLVWSRDLYQVATAFTALGDKASAGRALDYLFRVQQKPDGSFPQNSWLDGRPFWGSLQMDEVAYPLVLAHELGRADRETYTKHVRPAADFIVRRGPHTPQERWEEKPGYSPSTTAAEVAGLVCAAAIARANGDEVSSHIYLAAADDFAREVERRAATTTGRHGDGAYFLRLSFNEDPDDGEPFDVGNGGGVFDEREIVDAGFLELVRLGVRPPQDPLVARSLEVVDRVIRVETPNGASFYRYNHDGYGEMDDGRPWNWDGKYTGKGRLWALLAGERGQYELALGRRADAARRLDAMAGFANAGRMIPEQVWDGPRAPRPEFRFGEGTGSATPLAWSMAQFIRLATNLEAGRNLDTPALVRERYAGREGPTPRANADFAFPSQEALERAEAGQTFRVEGRVNAAGGRAFLLTAAGRRELKPDARGAFSFDLKAERGETQAVLAVVSPTGATYFRRARVVGLAGEELAKAASELYPPDAAGRVRAARVSPLVEGDEVTFIYRGAAKRVELAGDFTGWAPAGLVLRDVPGADGLKFIRLKFPRAARLEYKLIADGEWLLDPLNPDWNDNGDGGRNSSFSGPDYRPSPYADGRGLLRGRLETLAPPGGDARRRVQVYLPPGYDRGGARYPVLYVQDGAQSIALGRVAETADRMISEGKVEPFVIVFVTPAERMKEYWASDRFSDWMALTLVPFVDGRYRTRATRDGRALAGASLGGVISVWTALRHPALFSRVAGFSTAFQIDEERLLATLARLDAAARRRFPLRFYLDAGLYEPPIFETTRRANIALRARGYPVVYREAPAGHNYTAWRDRLPDAFAALWAK
ncbi:MAG TPA: glycoside hydrolase family 15 protein [Pyrinomonadaceae bacterium]|jgi:glucoamylase